MPNWKSYDSSVRLLSAILAAHPELKLNYQEIADSFGFGATASSMRFRFLRIKADAKAIREARANGISPEALDMDGGLCKEIAKRYGGDCTVSALDNRFRRVKADAKLLNDALAQGIDPITITTDSLNGKVGNGKEISKYYGDGCTASSLDHRFRPIKKDAQAMREGHAIADKYGEDCTAKAVSTRFERLKKEPGWLTNNPSGPNGANNGTGNGTPKKTATPRKKKPAVAEGESNEDDDEEFLDKKSTPKKSALNKTQGGRINKPKTPSKNTSFASAPIEVGFEEENIIKTEPISNGHANGHGNGYMEVDDEDDGGKFYDTNNGYISDADQV